MEVVGWFFFFLREQQKVWLHPAKRAVLLHHPVINHPHSTAHRYEDRESKARGVRAGRRLLCLVVCLVTVSEIWTAGFEFAAVPLHWAPCRYSSLKLARESVYFGCKVKALTKNWSRSNEFRCFVRIRIHLFWIDHHISRRLFFCNKTIGFDRNNSYRCLDQILTCSRPSPYRSMCKVCSKTQSIPQRETRHISVHHRRRQEVFPIFSPATLEVALSSVFGFLRRSAGKETKPLLEPLAINWSFTFTFQLLPGKNRRQKHRRYLFDGSAARSCSRSALTQATTRGLLGAAGFLETTEIFMSGGRIVWI